jgi:Bacterial archaeo-eukaryotic release factor family 3
VSTLITPPRPLLSRPDSTDLHSLMVARGLCVSILINTTPGLRMCDSDRQRLQAHARDVVRRLELEPDQEHAAVLATRLRTAIDTALRGPADEALGLFVSDATAHALHLPVRVVDRVVIDPTFATRDVVRAVQSNPSFLLLHMDHRSANLYRYNQKYLEPQLSSFFPALHEGRVRAGRDRERQRAFLRTVDVGLSRHVANANLPVVLVGGERVLGEFLHLTRNGARIAGMARGIHSRPQLAELEDIGRTAMSDHVADLNAAAHDTLHARLRARRAIGGLLGCWHAAATGKPELLVVEQHFAMPARMVADGRYVEPSDDGEDPDVIDDAVDDLIETVLQNGGFVSVVPDGTLREHGRVAMTLAS